MVPPIVGRYILTFSLSFIAGYLSAYLGIRTQFPTFSSRDVESRLGPRLAFPVA
ncbi:hypothetical protein LX36DRAFT_656443 [Colletotrichum falcatum]|nr:hypothetical protein LX36DRAFT_656443 [Colletotrichum falcatum]